MNADEMDFSASYKPTHQVSRKKKQNDSREFPQFVAENVWSG